GTLDFATPLGVARTDRAFVAELSAAFGDDLTAEELVFRTDHTVEFQVLFLQHVLGDAVRVVPLLASFGFEEARGDAAGRIGRFVAALRDTIARRRDAGARVVVVVSADLAHVGPRYGDPAPFDEEQLRGVEEADRALLETVAAGDAAALLDRIAADRDRFRICGFSPLYTALGAIGARGGRLLAYGRGPTDGAGSICSYASLALYDRAAGAPGLPITDGGDTR
ncbi:MAG TPA: AmmeMemoRadiSam system protein B, partial [Thermodesulfobacteriota bacterium]